MLHRAILGSLERFFGIYIEHCAGTFPVWLAPEQAVLVTVSEKQAEYARARQADLEARGLRIGVDAGADKLGAKIRNARIMRVPYIGVIGEKEVEGGSVAPRSRDARRSRGHDRRRFRRTTGSAKPSLRASNGAPSEPDSFESSFLETNQTRRTLGTTWQ